MVAARSVLSAFKSKAACVAVLIGLLRSLVLFTFPNPKLVLASVIFEAFVPPCAISITDPFQIPLMIVPTTVISVPTNLDAAIDPGSMLTVFETEPSKTIPPNSEGKVRGFTTPFVPFAPGTP